MSINAQPTVSVIVPTHNRKAFMDDLLASLAKSKVLPDEIIITDDCSSFAYVPQSKYGLNVQVLRHSHPTGPGRARNGAVHASSGDILLFTDDDCLVEPNWIQEMTAALVAGRANGLGGCGGRVKAADSDIISKYYDFHRILEPRPHDRANPDRIPYLVTANCGVWRHAFMRAGGFDGRIPTAGGEDAAFSMRMAKFGYHFIHVASAVVRHRYRPNLIDFCKTFYRYGLGGRYVVDRYLSR
jgi:glycosyltransferase involved in cell wall biosynthesis